MCSLYLQLSAVPKHMVRRQSNSSLAWWHIALSQWAIGTHNNCKWVRITASPLLYTHARAHTDSNHVAVGTPSSIQTRLATCLTMYWYTCPYIPSRATVGVVDVHTSLSRPMGGWSHVTEHCKPSSPPMFSCSQPHTWILEIGGSHKPTTS